jgi:hypothetical protein
MEPAPPEPEAVPEEDRPIPRALFIVILVAIAIYSVFIIAYRPGNDVASAQARCQQFYSEAKTQADTALVDYRAAIVAPQSGGRGLSCAEVSGRSGPRR